MFRAWNSWKGSGSGKGHTHTSTYLLSIFVRFLWGLLKLSRAAASHFHKMSLRSTVPSASWFQTTCQTSVFCIHLMTSLLSTWVQLWKYSCLTSLFTAASSKIEANPRKFILPLNQNQALPYNITLIFCYWFIYFFSSQFRLITSNTTV